LMSGKNILVINPAELVADDGSEQSVRSDSLRRFSFLLLSFIEEITDRAPTYFRLHRLTLRLNSASELNIISTGRAAEMIFKIAAQPHTLNQCQHLASLQTIHLKEYLSAAASLFGVELGYARETEQLNAIDLLFYRQYSAFDFNFKNCGTVACQEALSDVPPSNDDSAFDVTLKSLAQLLVDEYHRHREKHSRRVSEAIDTLEKGQVELPGNHTLNYYIGGKGEQTLLIVNAYGQGLGYWTKLMAELMEDHRVIVWLPRDHEHDAVGVNQFNPVGVHAEDLNCLLLHLGIENCDLLGWCTGPKLLLEFYARYPEKVSSMIFLNGTFKTVGDHQYLETEYESSLEPLFKLVNEMPHVAPLLIDSLKAVLLKQKLSREVAESPSLMGEEQLSEVLSSINTSLQEFVIEPFSTERSVVNYARQLLDFWSHDIASLLPCVQVPVLLIGGECDKIASPQMSKTLSHLIPRAKHLEVRGGSHYLQYEKYELMTAIIKNFTTNPRDFDFDHELLKPH
jgi:pimeloyl-ACP methyl ester carboxylesterase